MAERRDRPTLPDGSYVMTVGGQESRRFGEMVIRREGLRIVPFSVDTQR